MRLHPEGRPVARPARCARVLHSCRSTPVDPSSARRQDSASARTAPSGWRGLVVPRIFTQAARDFRGGRGSQYGRPTLRRESGGVSRAARGAHQEHLHRPCGVRYFAQGENPGERKPGERFEGWNPCAERAEYRIFVTECRRGDRANRSGPAHGPRPRPGRSRRPVLPGRPRPGRSEGFCPAGSPPRAAKATDRPPPSTGAVLDPHVASGRTVGAVKDHWTEGRVARLAGVSASSSASWRSSPHSRGRQKRSAPAPNRCPSPGTAPTACTRRTDADRGRIRTEDHVRRAMSVWTGVGPAAELRAVRSLDDALGSGRWAEHDGDLAGLDAGDLGPRLLVARTDTGPGPGPAPTPWRQLPDWGGTATRPARRSPSSALSARVNVAVWICASPRSCISARASRSAAACEASACAARSAP